MASTMTNPLSTLTHAQRNSFVYSLLYVLNAYHTESNGVEEGEHQARCVDLPPLPLEADHLSVQIQNTCCVILKHLMVGTGVEASTGEEKTELSLSTTVVEAGGLTAALKLYDRNLAASSRAYYEQQQHPHPQCFPLPHPNQVKVLGLLHAFSCNKAAIHSLFEEQRFDILFGFLRNGLSPARELITARMWVLLRHLPCGTGGGGDGQGESSWVQDSTHNSTESHIPTTSKKASWKHLHFQHKEERDVATNGNGLQVLRAEHLAHLLLSSEHWLDLLLDDLATAATKTTSTSAKDVNTHENSEDTDINAPMPVGPVSEHATMSIICQLLDYNDRFLAAILFDAHRHHALQTIVQLAGPPISSEHERLHHHQHEPSLWPHSHDSSPFLYPPLKAENYEEGDWDGPNHRIPHSTLHTHRKRQEHSHDRDYYNTTVITDDSTPVDFPSSRLSALYALYRMAAYARLETTPSAAFTLLWKEEAVSVLLKAFLNMDGSLELQGRKYAALALAELCLDETVRGHLLDVQSKILGGMNILEMIEWFLREEVYQDW